jgi:hypothetical protein
MGRNSLSRYDVAAAISYIAVWISPVLASWLVAISGRLFTYVAPHRQLENLILVGCAIGGSILVGVLTALFTAANYSEKENCCTAAPFINNVQRYVLLLCSVISGIGLYKSFDGTIFEKAYGGPSIAWLGNGAWSVFFLISMTIFLGERLVRNGLNFSVLVFGTIVFLPFLLCGSRIDYLSILMVLVAYVLFVGHGSLIRRVSAALLLMVWAVLVAQVIGSARYGLDGVTLKSNIGACLNGDCSGGHSFYLSTLGDIGVSIFQVIGLLREDPNRMVGLWGAVSTYCERLLPGALFPNRPGDLSLGLPEVIGGGSTHSLAEGYLVMGFLGVVIIGVVFGLLGGLSVVAGRRFRNSPTMMSWVGFSFPWLLLIRGGWYQFFSILKSTEVLLCLLLLLLVAEQIGFSMRNTKIRRQKGG